MNVIIGRKEEQKVLADALASKKAEMIAVVGRRRVGKTYLVRSYYREHIIFSLTGMQGASEADQLRTFQQQLQSLGGEAAALPKDWLEAFFQLQQSLESALKKDRKQVLFFDELPWLASSSQAFLNAFGYFWNTWASQQNLVVVICGSASSWIIQKVINDKGGLHNRVTKYLHLKPFSLVETKAFLEARAVFLNHYQIVQLYMAIGGVPLYLEGVEAAKSAAQNIDQLCFSPSSLLREEFNRLYASLFEDADRHIAVIRALAGRQEGLSRSAIIAQSGILNGGSSSQVIEELLQSDFIMAFSPYGKTKKDKIYRLIDEYSNFYLRFIEPQPYEGSGTWLQISQTQAYKSWSSYAFESICMKHTAAIKQALGISGVYSTTHSYLKKANETQKGVQIDMLLERADKVINLFEIKFYANSWSLSEQQAQQLQDRRDRFKTLTKTNKQIFLTLISTANFQHNQHSLGLIDQILTLDDLFLS